jgi:pimeloyl-ACP methyl ester carboxylesterase
MKVIFSHGKESGPWGSKIKRLAKVAQAHGCITDSIDYSDQLNPDRRVERLIKTLNNQSEDIILVGSSMGGYVSLVASEKFNVKGLFLLAPALYMNGYQKQTYTKTTNIEIVHGWSDDIVLPEKSIQFCQSNDSTLHLISGDHRLNSSIDIVTRLFELFLQNNLKKS